MTLAVETEDENNAPNTDEAEEQEAGQVEQTEVESEAEELPDDEGIDVVIEGEAPAPNEEDEHAVTPKARAAWAAQRKALQEKDRKIRELEAKAAAPAQQNAAQVGEKPTLASSDYDEERFERDLTAWHERKRVADDETRKQQDAQANAQKAWQATLDGYGTQKAALKAKDFDDVEAVASDILSVTQQGVILSGATNPAVVVYALGKNPSKAKELASIKDPVKFAFAVAKLEEKMKVTPRKTAPLPESAVRGSSAGFATTDSHLKKLEADAERTGDRTKVVAYRRQLKAKAST